MPSYVEQMKQVRWSCKRALNGHGNKSAAELLAEIPYAYDGIERGISEELIKRGIPQEKIVLAFLSPSNESAPVLA